MATPTSPMRLRLRLGPKQAWSPLDLGPKVLTAWWNPDLHGNTTYMTDDGGGLISSFSSLVSKTTVTAATTARPTWSASAWTPNSKAGLTFDGTANCLVATSFAALPTGATAGEIWVLGIQSDATATNRMAVKYGSGAGTASNRLLIVNNSVFRPPVASDGVTSLTGGGQNFSGAHILGGYWSGTTMGGRFDGGDFTPSATTTIATLNTTATRLRIGANNGPTANTFWLGVIRHVIITIALTSAQRLLMEGFFAWDGWGSAAANPLPASHPYKSAAPVVGN